MEQIALIAAKERRADRERLDDLVDRVTEVGSGLVDGWEATALIESLGYSDARMRRDFGFRDTRTAGDYVYRRSKAMRPPCEQWSPPNQESPLKIVVRSGASTLIYAVPWLAVFLAQIVRPTAMQMPTPIAPALAIALMFSLVASGGFVQAIVRRGEFYVGLQQVEMARQVVGALLRVGIVAAVISALLGMAIGWYFELFAWSSLVLGADAFVAMSVLWMVCGAFAIRQQQWRVAVGFIGGFIVFAVSRAGGADVVSGLLAAVAAVLAVAAMQMRRVFGASPGGSKLPAGVVMPRLSVLAYWTVPYFWYGTIYFAFLFADRLAAGAASVAIDGGTFGIPAQYNLGMELALLTLLVAASGVEIAGALFARAFTNEAVRLLGAPQTLVRVLRRHHRRAAFLTVGTFVTVAAVIGEVARRMLPGALTPRGWTTLLLGDIGYACLAVGLMNALVLFQTRNSWTVVRIFTTALGVNLLSGYVLAHVFGGFHAVDGLVLGSLLFAITSTAAVRRTLAYPEYAYAVS